MGRNGSSPVRSEPRLAAEIERDGTARIFHSIGDVARKPENWIDLNLRRIIRGLQKGNLQLCIDGAVVLWITILVYVECSQSRQRKGLDNSIEKIDNPDSLSRVKTVRKKIRDFEMTDAYKTSPYWFQGDDEPFWFNEYSTLSAEYANKSKNINRINKYPKGQQSLMLSNARACIDAIAHDAPTADAIRTLLDWRQNHELELAEKSIAPSEHPTYPRKAVWIVSGFSAWFHLKYIKTVQKVGGGLGALLPLGLQLFDGVYAGLDDPDLTRRILDIPYIIDDRN